MPSRAADELPRPPPATVELSLLDDRAVQRQRVLDAVRTGVEGRLDTLQVRCRCNPSWRRAEDDYEITKHPVRKGSDVKVFLAVSASGGPAKQKYAVKRMSLNDASPEELTRFRSEVHVFLFATHPHIATLHDVYESESHLYLVMEHLEGGDLFTRVLQRQALPEGEAAAFARQILLALGFLHRFRAAHRSLTPQSVCFDKAGGRFLKLCGFGSSMLDSAAGQELDDEAQRNDFNLTDCSAPETLRGASVVGVANELCDLWSVGVITFFVLSGNMPFRRGCEDRGEDLLKPPDVEVQRRILCGAYTTNTSVPASARSFMQTMMSTIPGKRGSVKQALNHSWFATSCTALPQAPPLPVLDALRGFPLLPRLRRYCLLVMAWSLSGDEHAAVRDCFLSLSSGHKGTIPLAELRRAFAKAGAAENDALDVCSAFHHIDGQGGNRDCFCCSGRPGGAGEGFIAPPEVRYSDFLAAMISSHLLPVSDHLICDAFRRFDAGGYGSVTGADLIRVLGDAGAHLARETTLEDADGFISFENFAAYVRGDKQLQGSAPFDPLILTPRDFEPKATRGGCCSADPIDEVCVAQ